MTTLDDNYTESLGLEDQAKSYLLETAKWGKILAIIGFIFIGLLVIIGLFMAIAMPSAMSGTEGAIGGVAFLLIYVVIGALYIYPTLKLYQFSKHTKSAINSMNSQELTTALAQQKSLYKFMGIFMLIIVGLYALVFVIGILVGGAGLMGL